MSMRLTLSTRARWLVATVTLATVAAAGMFVGSAPSSAAPAPTAAPKDRTTVVNPCGERAVPVAGVTCGLSVLADAAGRPLSTDTAAAADLHPLTAADLQDAYKLPSALLGGRQTIAVVVPFDYPTAEQDLVVYRKKNDLPACSAEFACLRKVNQRGGGDLPPSHPGWALSAAVGLQMASASCPNCQLLLVEADDATTTDLGAAVDQAVAMDADVVSITYRVSEYPGAMADAVHYQHGVPIVAPGGDGTGFPNPNIQMLPASYASVIAVGGTALQRDASPRGWNESAWLSGASGCSVIVPKPGWQKDKGCATRTVVDIAAVADPATPVEFFDSFGQPGWLIVGGTPVASALIAGIYALAGNAHTINPGRHLYSHRSELFDITTGSTGQCGGSYLCTAGRGYDGPTGLGTPNGIGAF